jgi:hypothetical protein
MGQWTQQSAHAWVYRVPDRTRPFGYALRQREDGPAGARWDALLVGSGIAKDTLLLDGVAVQEAKAAVERAAERRPWPRTGRR